MVTQRQFARDEELNQELASVDIDQTVQEAEGAERAEEAAQAADGVQPSGQDAFAQAAVSINASQQPVEPEVVDKNYFEARLADFQESLAERMGSVLKEVAPPTNPVASVAAPPASIEEQALERMLRESPNVTEEQIAHWRQQFRIERENLEIEERKKNEPDRIANIERRVEEIASATRQYAPPRQAAVWTAEQVDAINQAIDTLAIANGIVINRQDQTQMNAVINGVQAGENVQSVIQKVASNVGQIKSNLTQPALATPASQALQSGTAAIPQLGAAATTSDTLVFQSEDEIRDAIATNKIDVMEYEKYRAQLPRA